MRSRNYLVRVLFERWDEAEKNPSGSTTLEPFIVGEGIVKLTVLGLLAGVEENPEDVRYANEYKLVKARGFGTWAHVLQEILAGPAAQRLHSDMTEDALLLDEKQSSGYMFEAQSLMRRALATLSPEVKPGLAQARGISLINDFVQLRNAARAHGAQPSRSFAVASTYLRGALELFTEHHPLFARGWAFLHRNQSQRYRVSPLSDDGQATFEPLKRRGEHKVHKDGVYFVLNGEPALVPLAFVETSDGSGFGELYLPNEAAKENKLECLNYRTGDKKKFDVDAYRVRPSKLQKSHTAAEKSLYIPEGVNAWSNLPTAPSSYVSRPKLEERLWRTLLQQNRITTLRGRGGIGKTSTTIEVVNRMLCDGELGAAIWFSARDIDLLSDGPKQVSPDVLDEEEFAKRLFELVGSGNQQMLGKIERVEAAEAFLSNPDEEPILFILDNFETVRDPHAFFEWLYAHVALPHRVLITTREREFNGDREVTVPGMETSEASELYDTITDEAGQEEIPRRFKESVLEFAEGHPYVIRLLVSNALNGGDFTIPQQIPGGDRTLDALFKRTYDRLSKEARTLFLCLCGWRSLIAQPALEFVLAGSELDVHEVGGALNELERKSLVTVIEGLDGVPFATVRGVARSFGKARLEASENRVAIRESLRELQNFGVVDEPEVEKAGFSRALARYLAHVEERWPKNTPLPADLKEASLRLAAVYPAAGLGLANIQVKRGETEMAALLFDRVLEQDPEDWVKKEVYMARCNLAKKLGDVDRQLHAAARWATYADGLQELRAATAGFIQACQKASVTNATRRSLAEEVAESLERHEPKFEAIDFAHLAYALVFADEPEEADRVARRGEERYSNAISIYKFNEWLGVRNSTVRTG